MPRKRIASQKIPPKNVPEPRESEEKLSFSFEYVQIQAKPRRKFSIAKCAKNYLPKFLERLRAVCELTLRQLALSKPKDTLRPHPISWPDTTESNGFEGIDRELWDGSERQISITSNKHGRLHGFVIGSIFHVVWIDPDHELFPRK